jgi:type II secretory pathway pseudopilin PulG
MKNKSKNIISDTKSFTLVELLIVVGLIAVLSVAIILAINPAELIKQARDSQRLSDLTNLSKAISLYEADTGGQGFMGTSSVVYVSIPDTTSTCANLGLPQLPPSWLYRCVSSSTLQNIDGTGWIPINFNNLSFGKTLPKLPIDPINTTSSGNYYTYTYDNGVSKYELNANLESSKYKQQLAINDGGDNPSTYEIGSNLSITPNVSGGGSQGSQINSFFVTLGGTGNDYVYFATSTLDGGYIAVGQTYSYGAGGADGFIAKFNSSANLQIFKTIGTSGDDIINYILPTSDGGYIAVGYIYYYDNYGIVVKLDSSLNIQWVKQIISYQGTYFNYASLTSDGGYIIGGRATNYGTTYNSTFIIKIDSSGNLVWYKKRGNSSENNGIYSISPTSDGGYIAAGYTSISANPPDGLIMKVNSSNNIQWAKTIGGSNYEYIYSVLPTSDGGYIAAGYTNSYGAGNYDGFISKFDSSGNMQLFKTIGGSGADYIYFISQNSDGGYIAAGSTASYGSGNQDAFIIKFDSSLNIQWAKAIGGTQSDVAYNILQTSDGGYIVGGRIQNYGAGGYDGFIAKLDSSGNISNCSIIQSINPQASSPSPTVNSKSLSEFIESVTVTSTLSTVNSASPSTSNICPAQ